MPAIWTTPATWQVDQLVTNNDLNEQVRDNLEYLLSPNHERIVRDNSGDYSITNVTTFQDIDTTNLSITLVTHGGPVLVHLGGTYEFGGNGGYFDIAIDGNRVGSSYTKGLKAVDGHSAGDVLGVDILLLLTGLAAGTYTLRPQWRTESTNSATLWARTNDTPLIFEAIEL